MKKRNWKHGVHDWQAVTGLWVSRPRAAHTPLPCLYYQSSCSSLIAQSSLAGVLFGFFKKEMYFLYVRLNVNSSRRYLHVQALFVALKRVLATVLSMGQEVRSLCWLEFQERLSYILSGNRWVVKILNISEKLYCSEKW